MRSPIHFVRALLALAVGAVAAVAAETTPAAYLDAALDIMQRESINRDRIDWPAFRQKAHERIAGAKSVRDVYGPLSAALKDLGDGHSFFRPPPVVPHGEMKGDIAYVFLPGYPSGSPQANTAFADGLQKIIADLDAQNPKGWILDLRENTGGNMWPMMAGIGPLLGEGDNGRFVYKESTTTWWYRDGSASTGNNPAQGKISGKAYQLKSPQPPLAVLTGRRTSSSGEAIVVAFKGRPATRFFGTATSGQSTANRTVSLSDGAFMMLTTGTYADRTGKIYGKSIDPDEVITPAAAPGDSIDDPVMAAAIAWLKTQ